ncbi:hypothetical protein [Candidatus Symbiopectobacterium sp.]|uniref:hypothetical protein n=1 Tax=Candidatus Symbiopectobacterium sp. TaxID=2816440 RepID=UPI0025BF5395|nr:hypothetical protein [Candidatus Symbiopectobacterium sp.]
MVICSDDYPKVLFIQQSLFNPVLVAKMLFFAFFVLLPYGSVTRSSLNLMIRVCNLATMRVMVME